MQHSPRYTLMFAALVAFGAAVLVATAAVTLRDRQNDNRLLDRQRKVLDVAGLIGADDHLSSDEVTSRFTSGVRPLVIELRTGTVDSTVDAAMFDQRKQSRDPTTSHVAPVNAAGVSRLPRHALIYHARVGDSVTALILPIEGQGLWSSIYGFIAISPDLRSVRGITFYEHAETPGLGGEINTPEWRAKWRGKQPFDSNWQPRLMVVKGALPVTADSSSLIDGLSGATLTGTAVTRIVQFWLGNDAFGPYLAAHRAERGIS